MNNVLRRSAVLAAVAALTACSGDQAQLTAPTASPPVVSATFSAVVSGAVDAKLAGQAILFLLPQNTVDSTVVPPSTLLAMADSVSSAIVAFQWTNETAPKTGTFTVGSDSGSIAMLFDSGAQSPGSVFYGSSGTVTVSSVNPSGVSGAYSVTAVSPETHDSISVSGTFLAPVQTAQ